MRVDVRNLQDRPVDTGALLRVVAQAARELEPCPDSLSLVLMDDEGIHDVNRRFRHVDSPTDVIAFEAEEEGPELAGEVLISVQTAERQAQAAGHDVTTELAWLAAHGVLHVGGMDHATDEDLAAMAELQRRILQASGFEPR